MEEAEREEEGGGEEEEEEESPKELKPEEEEIAIAGGEGLGWFSALLVLGRRWSFVVEKSRCRGRLNSEKMEDGSAVFTFYEEPFAETLRLPRWLQCV